MNTEYNLIAQSSFLMLEGKIDRRILKSISCMGFLKPTEIQAKILPHLLLGKDLIGAAKTGSGKTLAFLVPVIENLIKSKFKKRDGVGSIIISPTRELALQINEVLKKLLVEIDLSHALIVGGEKKHKEIMLLQEGVNIIVSTPGRLLDHLTYTQKFNYRNLKCVILDEADKLLEAGFEKHIAGIMEILPGKQSQSKRKEAYRSFVDAKIGALFCTDVAARGLDIPSVDWIVQYDPPIDPFKFSLKCPKYNNYTNLFCTWLAHAELYSPVKKGENRQTALFSATIDDKIKNLARLALKNSPVLISVQDNVQTTVTGLKQGYFICSIEDRISWLHKMLRKCKKLKVMVFFSSCKSVDFHYELFKTYCKSPVISIHGKQSQSKRKEAYRSFVDAKIGALFCTDVAARGLDIPSVDWIVQYDPPIDVKEYIHRVGRTARGNNTTGNAVILLRPEEEEFVTFLKTKKVYLDKYNFEKPSDDVLQMLQDLLKNNGVMRILARKAYLSFLRCYRKHPLQRFFDINDMDLELAAKAFGFLEQPHVDFLNNKKK